MKSTKSLIKGEIMETTNYSFKSTSEKFDIQRVWDECRTDNKCDFIVIDSPIPFDEWGKKTHQAILVSDELVDQLLNYVGNKFFGELCNTNFTVKDGFMTRLVMCTSAQKYELYNGEVHCSSIEFIGFKVFRYSKEKFMELLEEMFRKKNTQHSFKVTSFTFSDTE